MTAAVAYHGGPSCPIFLTSFPHPTDRVGKPLPIFLASRLLLGPPPILPQTPSASGGGGGLQSNIQQFREIGARFGVPSAERPSRVPRGSTQVPGPCPWIASCICASSYSEAEHSKDGEDETVDKTGVSLTSLDHVCTKPSREVGAVQLAGCDLKNDMLLLVYWRATITLLLGRLGLPVAGRLASAPGAGPTRKTAVAVERVTVAAASTLFDQGCRRAREFEGMGMVGSAPGRS